MKKKWKPEMSGAWVTYGKIGFGQMIYVLYVPNHTVPIGLVWGEPHAERFNVAGSFVQPWARRNGVRTKINAAIFEHYKAIVTASGSKDGGLAFMKASGYQHNRDLDLWSLTRPKNKRRR